LIEINARGARRSYRGSMPATADLPPPPSASLQRDPAPGAHGSTAAPGATELDARGAPPPKPLDAIVVALEAIPAGTPQYVRTRGAPVDLLRALHARGVEAYPQQLPDGSWRTRIICPGPQPTPLGGLR
jgi:hypothetical protein